MVPRVGRHDQKAIDAPAHRPNRTRRLVRVAMHVAEQQLQTMRVGHAIDTAD